jgi:hypothetical protein
MTGQDYCEVSATRWNATVTEWSCWHDQDQDEIENRILDQRGGDRGHIAQQDCRPARTARDIPPVASERGPR